MRCFSIRPLLAVIVLPAVGFAALWNASDLWAGMMFLMSLAMLGVATLGRSSSQATRGLGGWVLPCSSGVILRA
jgi:hypothetical protein